MTEYVGARWQKCDFHLHSPASLCFKDREVTPEMWVQACLDQQLDCVAVTDHNTNGWIDIIKENISHYCEATIDHSQLSYQEKEEHKRQMKQNLEVYIQGVKDEMRTMGRMK